MKLYIQDNNYYYNEVAICYGFIYSFKLIYSLISHSQCQRLRSIQTTVARTNCMYSEPHYNEDTVITNNISKPGRNVTVKYVETNPAITNPAITN